MVNCRLLVASVAALVLASGCSGAAGTTTPTDSTGAATSVPPTTSTPGTPADGGSAGSTATSAGPTASDPTIDLPPGRTTIARGLTNPWDLAFLPDGSAFLTQRESPVILRLFPDGRTEEAGRVDDLAATFEAGMQSLALSPHFSDDGFLFVNYATAEDSRVVRLHWDGSTLAVDQPVLTGLPLNMRHSGGRLAFGPDGLLYVPAGDAKQSSRAQDQNDPGGKIHRINPDGTVPDDNPFPGSSVWSMGHRNVQGLAWDTQGRMVASEFGENTYDEINIIEKGKNYGWPEVEGPGGAEKGFVDPVVTWRPTSTCSPSGIAFDAAGENLYVGCLAGEHISRIAWHDGRPGEPERFVTDLGRVRAVRLGPADRMWAWTSNGGARDVVVVLPA